MTVVSTLTGSNWAQPVTKKRWVPITFVLEWFAKKTNYRYSKLARAKHRTWEYATGLR